MEQRQTSLAAQVSATKQQRRERLDQRVVTLLPDISGATMERLKHEVPTFAADRKVVIAFEQNKKVLWLFKPSRYNEALSFLQAQLKLYLERQGVVNDEDQTLQRLESEKAALATQQTEALEMLRLMEKAHRTDTPLPPEAVSGINSLARRGRNLGSSGTCRPPAGVSRFSGIQSSTTQTSSESDMDLWLWMMTDVPTSFRTLMLSSFSQHHDANTNHQSAAVFVPGNGGNFGGAGASGEFMPMDTLVTPAPETQPIATDDRLGTFS